MNRRSHHIEEGLLGRRNHERRRRRTWIACAALAVAVVAVAAGVARAHASFGRDAEAVFAKLADKVRANDWACGSSLDVGATGREWVLLQNGTRMANPLIARPVGKTERIVEEFAHCGTVERKAVDRYSAAHVTYEAPALFATTRKSIFLKGTDAICVQHMVDVFKGKFPCSSGGA